MSASTYDFAAEAMSFVESLDQLSSADDVTAALQRSLAAFGFQHFVFTGLPSPRQRFERMVMLRNLPPGWYETYARHDYVRADPVIRMCRNTVQPFEWGEAPYDAESEPRAAEVMRRATDFGLKRGWCLPVHGLKGYEACLSMSGAELDLDPRTKPAIHLMGMYAFERVRQILGAARWAECPLTAREREVLRWAAAGKSAADTATILSITERTVTAHAVNAMDKLGAANKTQAVARAISHGFIQPDL